MANNDLALNILITARDTASAELNHLTGALTEASDASDDLGAAARDSAQALDEQTEQSADLGDALDGLAEQFGLSGEAFDLLTGKLAGAAAIGVVAAGFIAANQEAKLLAQQFKAMTGDAATAAQEIESLSSVANRWGVAVNELAPAYLRLAAATKGSTAEGAATRKMIDDLTAAYMNAGAAVGDVEEAMEIIGEAFADGRVSADDLRQGMQEDMPPALQAATTAVLENNDALQKMLASGDAASEEFMPAFAAALREHIGGSQTHIDSVSASFTRLTERIKAMLVSVDSATGGMSVLEGVAQGAIKTLETGVAALEALGAGFAFVGTAVGTAAGALVAGDDALEAVGEEAEVVSEKLSRLALGLFGIKTAAQQAEERQRQMRAELQALREETDPYGAALERLEKQLEDAAEAFKKTGDAAQLTQAALQDFLSAPAENLDVAGILELAAVLKLVGKEAEGSGQQVSNTLGKELTKLTHEQLVELERQARSAMAAASDGSETSRAAFAELGQVVEGVLLARLEKLGVDGPEALRGISTEATEAQQNFVALADAGVLSADGIASAFAGALARLDNPQELEEFKAQLIALGEAGKLSGDELSTMLLQVQQRIQAVASDPALSALHQHLAQIREETARGIETGERERASLQQRIQSALELATAKGDEAEAAQLAALAAKDEMAAAELRIQQSARQAAEIDTHIQRLYAQANADGILTDAERKQIEALQEKSTALGQERTALEARLPLLEREAAAAAAAAGPVGQLARLYAEQTTEHQRAADANERYYDTQLKEIDGAISVLESSEQRTKRMDAEKASADKLKDSMVGVKVAYAELNGVGMTAFNFAGIAKYNEIIGDIQRSIDGANAAAQRLAAEGLGSIGSSAYDAAAHVESMARSLEGSKSYLDSAARAAAENLRSALASAREEAERLTASLSNMAEDFQREMLRMKGDEKALLELEHQDNLAKLKELHERAGSLSNRAYEDAKRQAEDLHRLKMTQLAGKESSEIEGIDRVHAHELGRIASTGAVQAQGLADFENKQFASIERTEVKESAALTKKAAEELAVIAQAEEAKGATIARMGHAESAALAKKTADESAALAKKEQEDREALAKKAAEESAALAQKTAEESAALAKKAAEESAALAQREQEDRDAAQRKAAEESAALAQREQAEREAAQRKAAEESAALAQREQAERDAQERASQQGKDLAKQLEYERLTLSGQSAEVEKSQAQNVHAEKLQALHDYYTAAGELGSAEYTAAVKNANDILALKLQSIQDKHVAESDSLRQLEIEHLELIGETAQAQLLKQQDLHNERLEQLEEEFKVKGTLSEEDYAKAVAMADVIHAIKLGQLQEQTQAAAAVAEENSAAASASANMAETAKQVEEAAGGAAMNYWSINNAVKETNESLAFALNRTQQFTQLLQNYQRQYAAQSQYEMHGILDLSNAVHDGIKGNLDGALGAFTEIRTSERDLYNQQIAQIAEIFDKQNSALQLSADVYAKTMEELFEINKERATLYSSFYEQLDKAESEYSANRRNQLQKTTALFAQTQEEIERLKGNSAKADELRDKAAYDERIAKIREAFAAQSLANAELAAQEKLNADALFEARKQQIKQLYENHLIPAASKLSYEELVRVQTQYSADLYAAQQSHYTKLRDIDERHRAELSSLRDLEAKEKELFEEKKKRRIKEQEDAKKDAIASAQSIQAEILELEGKTAEAAALNDKLAHERRKASFEKEFESKGLLNSAEHREAISQLDKLYTLKKQKREEDARKEAKKNEATQTPTTGPTTGKKIYEIKFGRDSIQTTDNPSKFLEALATARRSST